MDENKRIFISDLPEKLSENELRGYFSNYGEVSSIEIKKRKELGPKNKSLYFAYINLSTDHSQLNKCFRDTSNKQWDGGYLHLEIARESFLDRLKKEREENRTKNTTKVENISLQESKTNIKFNGSSRIENKKFKFKDNSSDSELDKMQENTKSRENVTDKKFVQISDLPSVPDLVIKNNKNKYVDKNHLKIPSVGKNYANEEPVNKIIINESKSNIKRLQSLQNMKKCYNNQQNLIREALRSVDNRSNKKIIFDGENKNINSFSSGIETKPLFQYDSDNEDESFLENFKIKEQFQGKEGQKLLELQSRYQNDKRFTLDERFIEHNTAEPKESNQMKPKDLMETENISEKTLEYERNTQLQILENIIGKSVKKGQDVNYNRIEKKVMRRFNATQEDYINLEVKQPKQDISCKKQKTKQMEEAENSKKPEVSKDVFYKVTDNLKETLQDKQTFSLLSTFGDNNTDKDTNTNSTEVKLSSNNLLKTKNPFKYDSTDEEDENEDIPHKDESKIQSDQIQPEIFSVNKSSQSVFWTEPLFFTNDDFRFQGGNKGNR